MKKTIIILLVLFFSFSGIVFAAEDDRVNNGNVNMKGEFLDSNILRIDVLVQDLATPVLGIAFHLKYDLSRLEFLRYEPGDFLERGGDPFYLVSQGKNSNIVFGETLRRNDNFPVGGGVVVSMYFEIIEDNEFAFSFDRGVVSTLDVVRQDLSNIKWDDYLIKQPSVKSFTSSVMNSVTGSSDTFSEILTMIGISVFSLLFAIFIIKKYGDKRHDSYVNFK